MSHKVTLNLAYMHLKVMDTLRASTMFAIATSPPGSPRCISEVYKDAYQMYKPEAYLYKLKRMWILSSL